MPIDYYLFSLINQYAGQNHYIDRTFIFFAEYLIALFLIFFLTEFKNVRLVFNAIISSLFVFLAKQLIIIFYFRPRPFVAYKVNLLVGHISDASFPSSHAAMAFAFATAVFLYNRKSGVLAYVFALLIAISRVFTGVHYVSDIAAGALIGILASLLVNELIKFAANKWLKSL